MVGSLPGAVTTLNDEIFSKNRQAFDWLRKQENPALRPGLCAVSRRQVLLSQT